MPGGTQHRLKNRPRVHTSLDLATGFRVHRSPRRPLPRPTLTIKVSLDCSKVPQRRAVVEVRRAQETPRDQAPAQLRPNDDSAVYKSSPPRMLPHRAALSRYVDVKQTFRNGRFSIANWAMISVLITVWGLI